MGEMTDGNMDEMEGCDGQGHVTMEILRRHDVEGDCCDYLTQTHTSRSLVQSVKDRQEGKKGESDRWKMRKIWSLLRQQWLSLCVCVCCCSPPLPDYRVT